MKKIELHRVHRMTIHSINLNDFESEKRQQVLMLGKIQNSAQSAISLDILRITKVLINAPTQSRSYTVYGKIRENTLVSSIIPLN
jgi:hypothetical protein